jgi:hypothetical protein
VPVRISSVGVKTEVAADVHIMPCFATPRIGKNADIAMLFWVGDPTFRPSGDGSDAGSGLGEDPSSVDDIDFLESRLLTSEHRVSSSPHAMIANGSSGKRRWTIG